MQMLQKLFFLFSILILSQHLMAQMPADQDFLIKTELDKRGLSEAEAEAALLAKGLDVKKMSPEEALGKRTEILGVLDELAAEKAKGAQASLPMSSQVVPPAPTVVIELPKDNPDSEKVIPEQKIEPVQEIGPEQLTPVPSSIYGHQLFGDNRLEPIQTNDGSTAPETYVLGAGDQLRITIFGISQADLLLTINEAGFVSPAGLAQIYLKGLTLKEARKVLRNRFSVAYRFQSDEFAVTLQQARMLSVNIFGETIKSGSIQLSALNTALNALAAVGGPTDLGSVRAIELIRGDSRKKIDLYTFLSNPSAQFQFDLQHNDILFVPVVQKLITLEGAVKRPMRYELIAKEGIKELITYAGGLNYNTVTDFVQVERYSSSEPTLFEYRLSDVLSGSLKIELLDGDIVRIKSNPKGLEQVVSISGSVFYPGSYDLSDGMSLNILLEKAQLKPQASQEQYFVERTLLDGTKRIFKVEASQISSFLLEKKDQVDVFDKALFTDQQFVEVSGAVRQPFKKLIAINDMLTVNDALAMAGGLKVTATDSAYILRQDLLKPGHLSFIPVSTRSSGSLKLIAGDQLRVFDRSEYLNTAKVVVSGAIREPFEANLAFGDELQLADVLTRSKGLLPTASDIAYLKRIDWFNPETYNYFKVNLKDTASIVLRAGDVLMIYDKSVYSLAANITVSGAVNNPQSLAYSSDLKIKDVILMSGGKKQSADLSRVEIFRLTYSRKSGSGYERISLKLDSSYNVIGKNSEFTLLPFDQIIIRDLMRYSTSFRVEATGEVKAPGSYPMPVGTYRLADLIKDAGGLSPMASKDVAILLRSAGEVGPVGLNLKKALNRKHSKKWNPFLLSGDVLTVFPIQNTFSIRTAGTNYPVQSTTDNEVSFVFSGAHSARWYLREYAGGLQEDADRRTVAVSYPNGRVDGTQRFLYLFNNMPTVKSGGQIVVNMKAPEAIQEKKEIDYDAVFTRSFQAISSLLTLLLLVNQL
jgi:protein involved in polysaccharide export with SLBB domain